MKNIIAIVLAVVVGIILVNVLFWIIGIAWGILKMLGYGLLLAVVIYILYRVFTNMVNNGKRFT